MPRDLTEEQFVAKLAELQWRHDRSLTNVMGRPFYEDDRPGTRGKHRIGAVMRSRTRVDRRATIAELVKAREKWDREQEELRLRKAMREHAPAAVAQAKDVLLELDELKLPASHPLMVEARELRRLIARAEGLEVADA
jgi:hypothetical protein